MIIRRFERGFTLLELLVAIAVFAVMSAIAYGGLRAVLDARSHASLAAERLAELQLALAILGRDVEQAINRPIRDEFGDREPALEGTEETLELTRGGWRNPAGLARSELQRVAWGLTEDALERRTWDVLDRTQGSTPRAQSLLSGVEELSFRYRDASGQWQPYWPLATVSGPEASALPTGVEVRLETAQWGEITRLFRVVPGLEWLPAGPSGGAREPGAEEPISEPEAGAAPS